MAKKEFRAGNRSPLRPFRVVNCEKLNLRSAPSKDADVLMVLRKGDVVMSVPASGLDWKHVTHTDGGKAIDGFCMSEFLEVVDDGSLGS